MTDIPEEVLETAAREALIERGTVRTTLAQHGAHLDKINGAMDRIALAAEHTNSRLSAIEVLLSEQRGGDAVSLRQHDERGITRRWMIGIAAAIAIAAMGTVGSVIAGVLVIILTRPSF